MSNYYYNPRGGGYSASRGQMPNFRANQPNFQNQGYGQNQYLQPRSMQAQSWGYSNRISGMRPTMSGIRPLFSGPGGYPINEQHKPEDIAQRIQTDATDNLRLGANKDSGIEPAPNNDNEPYDPLTATPDDSEMYPTSEPRQIEESKPIVNPVTSLHQSFEMQSSVKENVPDDVLPESKPVFYPTEIKSIPKKDENKFSCELCLVTCSSEMNLKAHLEGARHMKNVKKHEGNATARLYASLKDLTETIVGLNYIVEYQCLSNPVEERYLCKLCNVKGNARVIIAHVTGHKHRLEYVRKFRYGEYSKIRGKGNLTNETIRIAAQIEQTEGRGEIAVVFDENQFLPYKRTIPETPIDPKRKRMDTMDDSPEQMTGRPSSHSDKHSISFSTNGADTSQSERTRGDDVLDSLKAASDVKELANTLNIKPVVKDSEQLLSSPETWNISEGMLGEIMQNLSKCVIKNEEDARVALHVSTCLTHALLKYRLENMPAELLKATLSSESTKALLKEHAVTDFDA